VTTTAGSVPPAGAPTWAEDVYAALRERDTTVFCYVPDAGHLRLIELASADPDVVAVPLTSEEEGVAVQAGAHLGGARSVLLMQSSGVGNCVNFLSLIQHGRFPFLTLVSMRGGWGEQNPWQYPMGQAAETVLNAMGVITLTVGAPADAVPTVKAAIGMVDRGGRSVAVLLTQRLLGVKRF
jgi:sulfopyruvate decarboxylase alpha subunit